MAVAQFMVQGDNIIEVWCDQGFTAKVGSDGCYKLDFKDGSRMKMESHYFAVGNTKHSDGSLIWNKKLTFRKAGT